MCVCVYTGHVDHPAVAVLHQVARLTVDAAGCDAVRGEELRVDRSGLAVSPGRGQVLELRRGELPSASTHRATSITDGVKPSSQSSAKPNREEYTSRHKC